MEENKTLIEGGVKNNMIPKNPPLWKRISAEQFKETLEKHYGLTTVCANVLDCTYSQFWNGVKHWKLEDFLEQCKASLVAKAEQVILEKMMSQNEAISLKAALTVLDSLNAAKFGWGKRPDISIQQNIMTDKDKEIAINNIFGL